MIQYYIILYYIILYYIILYYIILYYILLNVYAQLLVLFLYRIGLIHGHGLFTIAVILICSQHLTNDITAQCGQRSGLLTFQWRPRCPVCNLKFLHASKHLCTAGF